MFQSTRPRGARPSTHNTPQPPNGFNPRARAGRDLSIARDFSGIESFNPRARAGRDRFSRISVFLQ